MLVYQRVSLITIGFLIQNDNSILTWRTWRMTTVAAFAEEEFGASHAALFGTGKKPFQWSPKNTQSTI